MDRFLCYRAIVIIFLVWFGLEYGIVTLGDVIEAKAKKSKVWRFVNYAMWIALVPAMYAALKLSGAYDPPVETPFP